MSESNEMTDDEILLEYKNTSVADFKKSIVLFYRGISEREEKRRKEELEKLETDLANVCDAFVKLHKSDKAIIDKLKLKISELTLTTKP